MCWLGAVQVFLLGKTVSFPYVMEDVMMESSHCAVTSIAFRTRGSLKKSNVTPFPSTASRLDITGDVVVYVDKFTVLLAI